MTAVLTERGGGAVYAASRLVIDAGTVVAPGAIAVKDGLVVAAGSPKEVDARVPVGFARHDFPGSAIVPGLVNAHTHLQIPRRATQAAASATRPSSFVDWILRLVAWRLGASPTEFPENLAAASAQALASGTTAVGEICGPAPDAYAACPFRARVYAEGIGFLPGDASRALTAVEATLGRLEEVSRSADTILPGISPHTLYTVGKDLLRSLGALAGRRKIPVCIHLAESPAEMTFLRRGGGEIAERLYPAVGQDVAWFRGIGAPIPAYLEAAGLLRAGLLLAHNVHLLRGEIDALRRGGARFVLCPRSNRAHGNGDPDVTHFADRGIPFALGTDSLASVPGLSLWDEMRAARSLYRGDLSEEELCRALFLAATENGSAALSLPGGTLRPGAAADFLVVDDPGGTGGAAIGRLVERGEAAIVRKVAVAGRFRSGARTRGEETHGG